jgi:hypothetical protein
MLTLVHTIAQTTVNTLRKMPALWFQLQRSIAQARADRIRVEAELFHGRYHLSSKNDDDLPLVS